MKEYKFKRGPQRKPMTSILILRMRTEHIIIQTFDADEDPLQPLSHQVRSVLKYGYYTDFHSHLPCTVSSPVLTIYKLYISSYTGYVSHLQIIPIMLSGGNNKAESLICIKLRLNTQHSRQCVWLKVNPVLMYYNSRVKNDCTTMWCKWKIVELQIVNLGFNGWPY